MATKVHNRMIDGAAINVKDFGAVGDGVVNDTLAIQEAFDSDAAKIIFPEGNYKITSSLTTSKDNRIITSDGATLTGDAPNLFMIIVQGTDTTISNLTFDGGSQCASAIVAQADYFRIYDNNINNFYTDATGCIGISVSALGAGWIERNSITDLSGPTTGNIGDGIGSVRAISVDSQSNDRTAPVYISDNYIDNILGREGDAIQVLGAGAGAPYRSSLAFIESNRISKCTRRGIKIQASDTVVRGNIYSHELPEVDSQNFAAAIDNIESNNVVIADNIADGTSSIGIATTGTNLFGVCIRDNNVKCGYNNNATPGWSKGNQTAILVRGTDGCVVQGNTIEGGWIGCLVDNSERVIFEGNNDVNLTADAYTFIQFQSTSPNYICRSNGGFSDAFARERFVFTNAASGVITDIHTRYLETKSNVAIYLDTSAFGSTIGDASNINANGPTLVATIHKLFVAGDIQNKSTNGWTGWPRQSHDSAPPTAFGWSVGDICWNNNPSVGQPVGWFCTSAGTPGVWTAMANL